MSEQSQAELLKYYITEENYMKIFITLKKFFGLLENLETKPNQEIEDFLIVFSEEFGKIIEPERQKMDKMRGILQKYLKNTFNQSDFDINDEFEDISENNGSDLLDLGDMEKKGLISDENISELSKKSEKSLESLEMSKSGKSNQTEHGEFNVEKDNFMKQKIVELVEKNINLIQILLFDKNFGYKSILRDILIKIYERFPEKAEMNFPKLFNEFIKDEKNSNLFTPLIDKVLDQSPKVVLDYIFLWFRQLNEYNSIQSKKNKPILRILFDLLKTYSEIYPEYCTVHLEELLRIFISNVRGFENEPNMIYDFAFIIHYFAKQGEYVIAEYSIGLYKLAFKVKGENQRLIFLALKQIFENYPDEIASKIINENREKNFAAEIVKIIKSIRERQNIDILIDIYLLMEVEISKISYNKSINNEDEIQLSKNAFLSHILKKFVESVEYLLGIISNSDNTYLLFKVISESDDIISEYLEKSSKIEYPLFVKKYIENEDFSKVKDENKARQTFSSFLMEIKQFINSLDSATI